MNVVEEITSAITRFGDDYNRLRHLPKRYHRQGRSYAWMFAVLAFGRRCFEDPACFAVIDAVDARSPFSDVSSMVQLKRVQDFNRHREATAARLSELADRENDPAVRLALVDHTGHFVRSVTTALGHSEISDEGSWLILEMGRLFDPPTAPSGEPASALSASPVTVGGVVDRHLLMSRVTANLEAQKVPRLSRLLLAKAAYDAVMEYEDLADILHASAGGVVGFMASGNALLVLTTTALVVTGLVDERRIPLPTLTRVQLARHHLEVEAENHTLRFRVYPQYKSPEAFVALVKQTKADLVDASVTRESPPGLAGELSRLADLHRRRILTDAEFVQAKQRLLGG